MRRVSVVGVSGSGKTTVAAALATRLGIPHVELDGLFHQPNWTELPEAVFAERVRAAAAGEAWVIDGNYSRLQSVVWGRADTVVVLDLPRAAVMTQLAARTLRRVATRQELWNGNRERWRNLVDPNPQHNILLWSWTNHARNRTRYRAAPADPRWAHLRFICLRSRRDVRALLETVAATR